MIFGTSHGIIVVGQETMQITKEEIRKILYNKRIRTDEKFEMLCMLFNEAYDYAYQEGLSMYRDDGTQTYGG